MEILFYFQPLPDGFVVTDDDVIVAMPPGTGGRIDSADRLRQRLDDKADRYDLRGAPFAIVVGVRDQLCDLDDVVQALIGTPAVVVATAEGVRRGDGFFGKRSRSEPGGKHTRVSSVFALQDWWPGGPYLPRITRFDNPFAEAAFPLDALPFEGHWGEVERTGTRIRADWIAMPRPRLPWEG